MTDQPRPGEPTPATSAGRALLQTVDILGPGPIPGLLESILAIEAEAAAPDAPGLRQRTWLRVKRIGGPEVIPTYEHDEDGPYVVHWAPLTAPDECDAPIHSAPDARYREALAYVQQQVAVWADAGHLGYGPVLPRVPTYPGDPYDSLSNIEDWLDAHGLALSDAAEPGAPE